MNAQESSPGTATGRSLGPHVALVLTCEHGGNRVPQEYRELFASRKAQAALLTHRGYDIGALRLTRLLGRRLGIAPIASTVTRLVVDLNRSLGSRTLFSEFVSGLDGIERKRLLATYYHPYRRRVESTVRGHMADGRPVLHLSVHSFTPRLHGRARTADVGLLYDPGRFGERRLCARWKEALGGIIYNQQSDLRIRRNYPYLGTSDALTTYLRRLLPRNAYLGIELEVNQALLERDDTRRREVDRVVGESLERLLGLDAAV